jgi:hypothetical protein
MSYEDRHQAYFRINKGRPQDQGLGTHNNLSEGTHKEDYDKVIDIILSTTKYTKHNY